MTTTARRDRVDITPDGLWAAAVMLKVFAPDGAVLNPAAEPGHLTINVDGRAVGDVDLVAGRIDLCPPGGRRDG